jgi:transposase
MIEAIIQGQYDPVKLADLARLRLRKKIPQLQQALHGSITEHHRFLLRTQMMTLISSRSSGPWP